MKNNIGKLLVRKLITTFIVTTTLSLALSSFYMLNDPEFPYNQGNQMLGWFLLYFMYIGVIILIYGNLVSSGLDFLQKKWFKKHDWLYVLLHGVFGLANGLFFQEKTLAFYGAIAALLYAILDKWLAKRAVLNKSVKVFVFIPIILLLLAWSYLQISSPPLPPFTKEDAVSFATSGEGSAIDLFPSEIGTWEGVVDGIELTRETSVKKIDDEVYLVTFTENWRSENDSGTWEFSYIVERGSSTLYSETGKPRSN